MGDVPWSRPVKANGIDLLETFSERGSQPQSPVRTSPFVPRSCASTFYSQFRDEVMDAQELSDEAFAQRGNKIFGSG
ncbi:hypothetical protein GGQ12_002928 [Salinibacter ruber]|nr:hypothetical protein [Salinibacter ruber]